MKITFSSTASSFYKTPYPSSTLHLTDSLLILHHPRLSLLHRRSRSSITPLPQSLSFSFDADEFRYLLHAVFCRCSLKLVSVVAAASTSSSRRRWFSDLVVASPVEDYFLYIDDLKNPDKEEAEKITQPNLDALGEDYSVCCQGTAFFPLQSCMNHSCSPNAKAFKRDEDRDGQATIIAVRPIRKGEEIATGFSMYVDWRMALVAWAVMPCHFIDSLIQAKSAKGFSGDYAASHFELVALASESSANIRTIASFFHEEHERGLHFHENFDIDEETRFSSVARGKGVDDSGYDENEDILLTSIHCQESGRSWLIRSEPSSSNLMSTAQNSMDKVVDNGIANLKHYHSQYKEHIMNLLNDGESSVKSIINVIDERVRSFNQSIVPYLIFQRDGQLEDHECRDVHISPQEWIMLALARHIRNALKDYEEDEDDTEDYS
ncbi:hypothetical protein Ahy_B01g053286 [Arachis hypogaea]|uniref:SET domain-containing protein n=1 Tax=Arachis hypogaea TaxID=3818 RepID=A0A445ARE8_ARAHY|nr:hypothetical protein Ahy_B01g053286 [Arachis hypogaea]